MIQPQEGILNETKVMIDERIDDQVGGRWMKAENSSGCKRLIFEDEILPGGVQVFEGTFTSGVSVQSCLKFCVMVFKCSKETSLVDFAWIAARSDALRCSWHYILSLTPVNRAALLELKTAVRRFRKLSLIDH